MKTKIILLSLILLVLPSIIWADDLGQRINFFVDPSYDLRGREKISGFLQRITDQIYFYLDEDWWNSLALEKQREVSGALLTLSQDFENKIYPILTLNFGSEWKPGIDQDVRITILFHPMKEEAGGYFNSGDEYPRIQNSRSNQREMVYLNTNSINSPSLKSFLSHEFTHLITFNQKDKIRGVSEEIWLNEARADYAPALLGYDNVYEGSNLQRRVKNFLERPQDSLTEWLNSRYDYGAVNLFTQYLVDHYGIKILVDSLRTSKVGILSINEALAKNGFADDFSQIFTDWTIAIFLNDCKINQKYCYLQEHLKNFRVTPYIYFLPTTGESSLSTGYLVKEWSGNWQKIVGGKGTLTLEFDGADEVNFKVPYLVCDYQTNCTLQFLNLDQEQKGKIILREFNTKYNSLTIIPSIQSKFSGFDGEEKSYLFSWKASIVEKTEEEKEAELKKQLLAQINFLQEEIARIQAEINKILGKKPPTSQTEIPAGFSFEKNLSFGMADSDVVYLKIILEKEVSHENWSGNDYFGTKTLVAVKAFQEKYKEEISQFAGYQISASGFVGKGTRAKLNQLLQKYK